MGTTVSDTNKENNANVQNVTGITQASNLVPTYMSDCGVDKEHSTNHSMSKVSSTSVSICDLHI